MSRIAFSKSIGKSPNYVAMIKSVESSVLVDIHNVYPRLNIMWLLFGEGCMLIDDETKPSEYTTKYTTEYVEDLLNENKQLRKRCDALTDKLLASI
jgi:hypothetical protein